MNPSPSGFQTLDERFNQLHRPLDPIDHLFDGCRWSEGPAYFPAGRYLLFSDNPNDRMLRYDECDGSISVFREPSANSNGNTTDRSGRLVSCEHANRRVTRTEIDGRITVIADRYEGKRFNSPNDVIVQSDGSVWFSDPTYGVDSDYEGNKGEIEQRGNFVYRVDPSGEVRVVADDFVQPNGLAFSPDESILYISDTGRSHRAGGPAHIRKLSVTGSGLKDLGEFAESTNGMFDGFRVDVSGNVWTSAGDGVHCYHPDGTLLGKILIPDVVANVCFGGPKRNYLYICATQSLYGTRLMTNGVELLG